MSRPRSSSVDLGNPISMEDALSILVVTFVLFVLFLIPLVKIDRTKLEQAQRDTYWQQLAEWLAANPSRTAAADSYVHAFGLEGHTVRVNDAGKRRYIEALSPSGDITIILHEKRRYISCLVKGHSSVVTYRYGDIRWSASEREWFTANNTIDYGEKDFTRAMQKAYREWTKRQRGF